MKKVFQYGAWLLAACSLTLTTAGVVQAQEKVKIGYLTDMSSVYSDVEGKDGAVAIQMAIDDFGGKVLGQPIELITADHQSMADIAASKAREWIDTQGVTMLTGAGNSSAALAMAKVAQEKKRVLIVNGAGTAALTNEACSPYTVHYDYDTAALARGTASAVIARGGKSWFFLTVDYALGQSLQDENTRVIKEKGGTVVGAVKHPLGASDFSSFLLQAQSSGAQVLGLADAGSDLVNVIKAAKEFGINKAMKTVGLVVFLSDVHSLGLENAQGLLFTTSWYWDMNDASRKWAERFYTKTKRMPTDVQAADYSGTMTYLKAVQAAGTTDADKVMAQIKSMKIDDFFAKGYVRPDGSFVHDMYLVQVKMPAESHRPWDYLKVLASLPGDQVFTTKAESRCKLWK
ncbi:MAG: ABC transporter substrate-binding protein [Burkholderiaceae bacterium]|nr:ABC transporter substrate-binding protein [Burkholderiaceae bacterium]